MSSCPGDDIIEDGITCLLDSLKEDRGCSKVQSKPPSETDLVDAVTATPDMTVSVVEKLLDIPEFPLLQKIALPLMVHVLPMMKLVPTLARSFMFSSSRKRQKIL